MAEQSLEQKVSDLAELVLEGIEKKDTGID